MIFVVFVNVPLIVPTALPCAAPPVKPTPVGAVQVYKVPVGTTPFTPSVGVALNNTPLHVVVLIGVMIPIGLIVTTTVNGAFTPHNTVVGVTVYVAVCALLVGLFKVPVILIAPLPLVPPVSPPVTLGALQLYRVPAGTMPLVPLVGVNVNDTPLQLTVVIWLITAVGLIVTVTVNVAPVQLPDNGVTK